MNNKKCLFISHAEKDNDIVSALVDLLYDIGIQDDSMLCSSISEIGVPVKVDIYDYLREELNSDGAIPIFVLSENYYKSAACLNEMGAVWVRKKDYYIFLIPPFNFSDIRGAINPNKKGIILDYTSEKELYNLKDSLNQFKTQLQNMFDLVDYKNWERKRDEFIRKIHNINNDNSIINIDIDKCEGFCIGAYDTTACIVQYDSIKNEICAHVDFSLTESDICSIVIYTDHIDLHKAYNDKKIYFEIESSDSINIIELECLVSGRNIRKTVIINSVWERLALAISDFGGFPSDWKDLCEIKFLLRRQDIDNGNIRIRNISIV